MRRNGLTWGLIFIVIGGLLLYNNVFGENLFSMARLWPLFILGPGIIFEAGYFGTRKDPGLLVPGGILTTIGLLFLFQTYTNWHYMRYSWPIFIFAVAIGLFQLYIFSGRPKGLLIPVFILTAVAGISFSILVLNGFMSFINYSLIAPIALIVIGAFIIFGNHEKKPY